MTNTPNPVPAKGKGKAFFDRADQVAETGSWDFAIELYIQGIEREADNLERGHKPLREAALQRKMKGGKPAGFFEKGKYKAGKEPLTQLVAAEFLLSKDPGNEAMMEQFYKAAKACELPDVAKWMLDILLESQRQKQVKVRNKRLLQEMIKAYDDIKDFDQALVACMALLEMEPTSNAVSEILKDLQTKKVIQKGGFGDEKSGFDKGIRDQAKQRELIERDSLEQSKDFKLQEIERKKAEYLEATTIPGKINAYAESLLAMQDEGYENEAIDVLLKAHRDTSSYQYKMKVGDIRITQHKRKIRKAKESGDKTALAEATKALVEFELAEFTERAANYPTDLTIKFGLGRRQYLLGHYDEAIGTLQQARRDSRNSLRASVMLAKAFEKKGMHDREAADTLEDALKSSQLLEEQEMEIRYLLGKIYIKMNQLPKAEEQLSRVTQLDYNYEDARVLLEQIRQKLQDAGK